MAVRNDFTAGEVLAAADLNDTFGSKADKANGYQIASIIYYTSNGTFQKSLYPNARALIVKCQGAGGGSGGVAAMTANDAGPSGGGGGGAYAESFITDIAGLDASVTVTVGAGGAAGAAGFNGGSDGGNSSFGALVVAAGGKGGGGGNAGAPPRLGGEGGNGGSQSDSTGDFKVAGQHGQTSFALNLGWANVSGGGQSFLGNDPTNRGRNFATSIAGIAGALYGGGAGGPHNVASAAAQAGAAGGAGIVIVEVYS
jgi:hypothetical protein